MISFIVIGKNEEKNLKRCFDSIGDIIKKYKQFKFECIYVDSDSQDKSIQIANNHTFVSKLIMLTGDVNSAIARNVGAFYSQGGILFFVDGDMVLVTDFIQYSINFKKKRLIHPIITGDIINIIEGRKSYYYGTKLKNNRYVKTTGGIFMIERKLWIKFNGMDIRFKRSQDLDFFYGLSSNGIKVLRKKEVICYHNTIPYFFKNRIKSSLSNKYSLYSGLFYRKYILKSLGIFYLAFRRDYSSFFLFLVILSIILFSKAYLITPLLYLIFVSIRNFLSEKKISFLYILYRIISDFYVIIGFFVFFPSRIKKFDLKIMKGKG